jgi:hypothetical protein
MRGEVALCPRLLLSVSFPTCRGARVHDTGACDPPARLSLGGSVAAGGHWASLHPGARASPASFAAQWGVISYKVSLSELTFTLRMGSEARCNGLRRGTAARSAHDRPAAGADRGAWGILGRARGRDNQHGVE